MAINLATKYEKKLDERFTLGSKTDEFAGKEYDFVGANAIEIITADTVAMVDYTRSGTSRFGQLTELGDTKQTLTMTKDRAFTFSIDAGNAAEQFNVKQANRQLKNEYDEVTIPEIDTYRLNAWATGRGLPTGVSILTNATPAALTNANIVEAIFTASAAMSDHKVPAGNRVLYIGELDFLHFKLANLVMGGAQLNKEAVEKGYKGTIDGIRVITVPSIYMPTKVGFIMKWKNATVDPIKLKKLKVHKDPMGVDGDVVEGRVMYDAFVRAAKAAGVYAYRTGT